MLEIANLGTQCNARFFGCSGLSKTRNHVRSNLYRRGHQELLIGMLLGVNMKIGESATY